MRIFDLFEYKTKDGKDITFEYLEDIEGNRNRGWQIDQIKAYVDGDWAGYLKIGYIPSDRFEEHYPTIFHYMAKHKSKYFKNIDSFEANDSRHYTEYSNDELVDFLNQLYYHNRRWGETTKELKYNELSREDLLNEIKRFEKLYKEKYKKEYNDFKKRFRNNPYVDFIRVFSPIEKESGGKDFRRNHIAVALYLEGAKWMKSKGMKFRASGTQSKAAEAAWSYLEKHYPVKKIGKFKYLDI